MRAYQQLDFFYKNGLGYANEMAHRPQTLYGIEDSPIGLAAWMIDHDASSQALIARVFDGQSEGLTRETSSTTSRSTGSRIRRSLRLDSTGKASWPFLPRKVSRSQLP
jgi:hypothetical protein